MRLNRLYYRLWAIKINAKQVFVAKGSVDEAVFSALRRAVFENKHTEYVIHTFVIYKPEGMSFVKFKQLIESGIDPPEKYIK